MGTSLLYPIHASDRVFPLSLLLASGLFRFAFFVLVLVLDRWNDCLIPLIVHALTNRSLELV
jgi:hypothetical protein